LRKSRSKYPNGINKEKRISQETSVLIGNFSARIAVLTAINASGLTFSLLKRESKQREKNFAGSLGFDWQF